jgi:predicted  nucleic acid-binding Zn-ribbon protein
VEETPQSSGGHLAVVASVRCLECGALYAKPAGGGTVRSNPGCPECGYLGWVAVPSRPRGKDDDADGGSGETARPEHSRPHSHRARTA